MTDGDASMTVYLEHQGQPVAKDKLAWLHKAPCGCYSGIAWATYFNATTPEEAASEIFADSAAQRKRNREDGFTVELWAGDDNPHDMIRNHCTHTPLWGCRIAVPDGYQWAMTAEWNTRSRTKHLVKADTDERALCGAKGAFDGPQRWQTDRVRFPLGTVTCRRCEAKVIKP